MRYLILGLLISALTSTALIGTHPPVSAVTTDGPMFSVNAAQTHGKFSGRVVSSSNSGSVQGARISLDLEPVDGVADQQADTDLFGLFRFDGLPSGTYSMTVSHPAFRRHSDEITLKATDRLNRSISIDPTSDDPVFDITFNVLGVLSQVVLPDAQIVIQRWGGSGANGTPVETRRLKTDERGTVQALSLSQGFYAFTVTRPGWEELRFPETGTQLLAQAHMATAGLTPVPQNLRISATGVRPTDPQDIGIQPLKGITVEITGLDFEGLEAVPPRAAVTGVDGTYEFRDLPPIKWKISVERLGYQPYEETISPNAAGALDTVDVALQIIPTRLHLDVKTPFQGFMSLDPARVKLRGLRDSNTEGIERDVGAFMGGFFCPDPRQFSGCPLGGDIDRLLPGRYWLHVSHDSQTISTSVAVSNLVDIDMRFMPVETFIDIGVGETQEKLIELKPVPAMVHVQLLAADDIVGLPEPGGSGLPVYAPKQQKGVTFEESYSIQHLPPQLPETPTFISTLEPPSFEFDTDAEGRFTAELLPGRYGVRIPTMDRYSGYNIDISGDFSRVPDARFSSKTFQEGTRAWPSPDKCPYPAPNSWPKTCAPPGLQETEWLSFSSGEEYFLTLRVHKHHITLEGLIKPDALKDPTVRSDFVVGVDTSPVKPNRWIREVTELVNFGGVATLTGSDTQQVVLTPTHRGLTVGQTDEFNPNTPPSLRLSRYLGYESGLWRKLARYQFDDLGPGEYTISGSHPRMSITSTDVTIPTWPTPGNHHEVDPAETHFAWPGLMYSTRKTVQATYNAATSLTMRCEEWIPDDPNDNSDEAHYRSTPCGTVHIKMSLAEGLWTSGGRITPGAFTIWAFPPGRTGQKARWLVFHGTADGSATHVVLHDGGPLNNGRTTVLFPGGENYRLTTRAVHLADPDTEIPNVVVVVGGVTMTTGTPVDHSGSLSVDSVESPGWTFANGSRAATTLDMLSSSPPAYRLTIPMERAMVVQGTVRDISGNLMPEAPIKVYSRYGELLEQSRTDDASRFEIKVAGARAGFVEAAAPGFVPHRQRFEPGVAAADGPVVVQVEDISLERLRTPQLGNLSLDRFGLFLPGVSKSGDSNGFNTRNASRKLTLSWQATVRNLEENYPITGFDSSDGKPSQTTFRDRIEEVWLLDRRWFKSPPINSADSSLGSSGGRISLKCVPGQETACVVEHEEAAALLAAVRASKKNDAPYYVVWDRVSGRRDGTSTTFSGTLKLWELPSGEFTPMVMAVTTGGSVAVLNYSLPPGENSLRGVGLPNWTATILDGIGVAATYTPGTKLGIPKGWFVPLPAFEASIDFTPADNADLNLPEDQRPRSSGYLTYTYKVAGNWVEGVRAPSAGALSSGPSLLGFAFQGNPTAPISGASVEVKIDGKASTVGIEGSAELSVGLLEDKGPGSDDFSPSFSRDPILGKRISVDDPKVNGKASIGLEEVLDTNWPSKNRIAELRLNLKVEAGVSANWLIDVSDQVPRISRFIPPPAVGLFVGTALDQAAQRKALRFYVVVPTAVGGSRSRTFCTIFPSPAGEEAQPPGSTIDTRTVERPAEEQSTPPPPAQPPSFGFLGGGGCSNTSLDTKKVYVGFGMGMRALVGENRASLTGTIEIPKLEFTYNNEPVWPPITRIQGDVEGKVEAVADLWVAEFSHKWVWKAYRIDWQFGTEPYFILTPLGISNVAITPATAKSASFNGHDLRLIKDFYPVGSLAGTGPGSGLEALAFTDIDEGQGDMTLKVSVLDGTGWKLPVQVAGAPGIIGASIAQNPEGGLILVWSELSREDVLSPFPSSVVKYAISDAGGEEWSDPAVIARESDAAHGLELVRAGRQGMLVYLTTQDGPGSPQRALNWTSWDGSDWSKPQPMMSQQDIASVSLGGNPGDSQRNAVVAASDGKGGISVFIWDGSSWMEQPVSVNDSSTGLSASIDSAGRAVIARESTGGGIIVSILSPTGNFSDLGPPIPGVSADALVLTPVGAGGQLGYLLTWTQGADRNSVYYAVISNSGTLRIPPTEATPGSHGVYRDLHVRRVSSTGAAVITQFDGESTQAHQIDLFFGSGVRAAMIADDVNGGRFRPGDELEYTIAVTNLNSNLVEDSVGNEIQVPLPLGVDYVQGSVTVDGVPIGDDTKNDIGHDSSRRRVVWNGTIDPGSIKLVSYRVRSSDRLVAGARLDSQARVMGAILSDDPSTPEPGDVTSRIVASESGQSESPTDKLGPTVIPKPTDTPNPTVTPRPTDTPRPTVTPRPTDTPRPTVTPRPTDTPRPTITPKPTDTPGPTIAPKPTETPTLADLPQPKETPGKQVDETKPTTAPGITPGPTDSAAQTELLAKRESRSIPPQLVDQIYCNLFGLRCR